MSAFEQLLLVQEQDTTIDQLQHRIANLAEREQVIELDAELADLAAETDEVSEQRHVLEREQKRLEDEVALLEAKIERENAKLYSGEVTGVKELQALQDEIASLKRRQAELEDEVIAIMEEAEPVDATLGELATKKSGIDERKAEVEKKITIIEAEIGADLDTAQSARAGLVADVPGDLLERYAAIRADTGGVGVARFSAGSCEGCHMKLSAVEVDRIKKESNDTIVTCDSCGRLLVR